MALRLLCLIFIRFLGALALLARYARVSPEALQAWQQDRDPARRR